MFLGMTFLLAAEVPLSAETGPRPPVAQTIVFATVDIDSASTLYHETTSAATEFDLQCAQANKQLQPHLRRAELTPPTSTRTHDTRAKTLSSVRPTGFTAPRKLCPSSDGDDPFLS
jgi:hypothetical protein